MSDIAISVENISKHYRIGVGGRPAYHRLSEMISGVPRALWNYGRTAFRPSKHEPGEFESANSGEFWALKDVSFEVKQGEIVGIIGRNGAGKSTLLKILSRITEPTSGRFGLRGRVASLLEVGTGFHPELSGRENIYVSGVTLGMTRAEIKKRFAEIIDFSGVEKFLDTPVKHYSSGMQVRLGFAVAAHLESEILIVDEVLAVGDAEFQTKCIGKMGTAAQSGRTLLFVSHNIGAIRALCDQAIWLDKGVVVEAGSTHQIAERYIGATSQSTCERNWENSESAPGSRDVKLKRIAVLSNSSGGAELVLSTSLRIEVEFCVLTAGLTLNPSLVIQSSDGIPVFNAVPTSDLAILSRPLEIGTYRCTCFIPTNLLNDERYHVQLYMIRNHSVCEWRLDDLLSFEMRDDLPRSGWYGKWIGLVRPTLRWEYRRVEPQEFPAPLEATPAC